MALMIETNSNTLKIGDLWVTDIADQYHTPMYIYDAEVIEQQIKKMKALLHPSVKLFYSLKSNPNPTLVRWIYDLGASMEICSLNELEIMKQIGVLPEHILYLGPGKT